MNSAPLTDIRLFKPSIGREELEAVSEAFQRSWVGLGGQVSKFEEEFASYVDAPAALALNSGTAALQLAVRAFNFPKGSKILVNNLTFVASATAILINDLTPVLVDCNPDTLGFDLNDAAKKLDEYTVAMIIVHYGGHPAPMDEAIKFASSHGLKVIEDCAHCIGGFWKGRRLGTWGDAGCYSFEEKKGMTTGDGGMLVFRDPEIVEQMKPYRWVGIDKDTWRRRDGYTNSGESDSRHWHYEVAVLGYKYNMNDLAASIGRVQLRKLEYFNQRRKEIIHRYLQGLSSAARPLLPYSPEGGAYWLFGIRTEQRDEVIDYLKRRRIATGVHYMPLSLHPLFAPYNFDLPVSNCIWKELLTLPLHPDLTDEEVDRVIVAINEVLS